MAPVPLGPWVSLLLVSLFATPALAQQASTSPTTASDPQAIALATKALVALTGGKPITDVTLTGSATRTAGSDIETGTITLQALGTTDSRMDFAGSDGNRSEIRNSSTGAPQGSWTGVDGVNRAMASHNCMTDAVWFFPAFSILSQISQSNAVATYVGQETRNGASVQHLHFVTAFPTLPTTASAFVSSLTAEDVYLDATTLLPVAITFNSHPDNNAAANIAAEVDFSGYAPQGGIAVPATIQELLNGGVFLSISVESALVNSGLSASIFAIPESAQ